MRSYSLRLSMSTRQPVQCPLASSRADWAPMVRNGIYDNSTPHRLLSLARECLREFVCILVCSGAFLFAQTALPNAPSGTLSQHQEKNARSNRSCAQSDQKTPDREPIGTASPTQFCNSKEDTEGKQTKRMFWVVPNFSAVSADTQLPPLSAKQKFRLAMQDTLDYSSFAWAGMLSLQSWATNSNPELGHGIAGYGRYYGRTFADGLSGTFFSEALVPSITGEDPRYYTLGHGNFFHRTGYAMSRVFVTRTDHGEATFNWSIMVGDGLDAGLSNAYYPPQDRGLKQTVQSWGTQMEGDVLINIVKEFWPDIRRKIFRQK
jgi:hypothetical protein